MILIAVWVFATSYQENWEGCLEKGVPYLGPLKIVRNESKCPCGPEGKYEEKAEETLQYCWGIKSRLAY